MPQEGVAYIKEEFGLDISAQMFSSYKSQQGKKNGTARGRRGRPPRTVATSTGGTSSQRNSSGGSGAAELARQVKALVTRYGAAEVSDMLAVLSD
jgi:hypothetical protein